MTQHIFFICQSCQLASANKEESEPAGTILLNELQALHQNWSRKSEFEIRGVGRKTIFYGIEMDVYRLDARV